MPAEKAMRSFRFTIEIYIACYTLQTAAKSKMVNSPVRQARRSDGDLSDSSKPKIHAAFHSLNSPQAAVTRMAKNYLLRSASFLMITFRKSKILQQRFPSLHVINRQLLNAPSSNLSGTRLASL